MRSEFPPLPIVPVIAGFNGINAVIRAFTGQLRLQSDRVCDTHGAYNFWFAASILKAFREDQKNRKEVMYALADNLSKSESDFIDIEGHSVRAGVEVTLRKNLTHGNSDGQPQVDFLNSLASVERRDWLSEIRVSPTLLYTDNTTASGCNAAVTPLAAEDINHPRRPGARQTLNRLDPTGNLRLFAKDSATLGSDLENPYAYSLGVEKNPWIWAYVGVKAETAPRQLFFPIGPNARMVARAFAKPFGGRIGPWYGQTWPFGSPRSSDGERGSRPDALLPPRNLPNGSIPNPTDLTRLPNYSRFPGDLHGMNSSLALASLKNMKRVRVWYDFYRQIADTFEHAAPNDIMPWNFTSNQSPTIRTYESAAIIPDLFDITYYSIEPNFNNNYLSKLEANRGPLGIPASVPLRGDLGSRESGFVSIQTQIDSINREDIRRREAFYFVQKKAHLLTAWLPSRDYRFDEFSRGSPVENFGNCELPDDALSAKVPGSCAAGGGRSGYSVKLISRDALLNGRFPIGGPRVVGPVVNKPPDGW